MRLKMEEMVGILTSLLGDLATAVTVLKDYENSPDFKLPKHALHRQCIWRLSFNSIVINCYKFAEFSRVYGKEINLIIPEMNVIKKRFVKDINNNTAITELRNDYVAHVRSDSKKRALSAEEVQSKITSMVGGSDASQFLDWVCPDNIEQTDFENSLVGTITLLRDAISAKL